MIKLECTHNKYEWKYTEDNHSKICVICGKEEENGGHTLNTSGKCKCGYKYEGTKCSKNNGPYKKTKRSGIRQ